MQLLKSFITKHSNFEYCELIAPKLDIHINRVNDDTFLYFWKYGRNQDLQDETLTLTGDFFFHSRIHFRVEVKTETFLSILAKIPSDTIPENIKIFPRICLIRNPWICKMFLCFIDLFDQYNLHQHVSCVDSNILSHIFPNAKFGITPTHICEKSEKLFDFTDADYFIFSDEYFIFSEIPNANFTRWNKLVVENDAKKNCQRPTKGEKEMKIRTDFVANSSSSSFLVSHRDRKMLDTSTYETIEKMMEEIEECLVSGMCFSNITKERWQNVYKKEIETLISQKYEMSKEDKERTMEILRTLKSDLYEKEKEEEKLQTDVNLTAMETLLKMDGIEKE